MDLPHSVAGILMFISKHVTAVLSVVSHLVEVRLNSHLGVLPRAPHLQSGHKVLDSACVQHMPKVGKSI